MEKKKNGWKDFVRKEGKRKNEMWKKKMKKKAKKKGDEEEEE